jgi:hypothetical protein
MTRVQIPAYTSARADDRVGEVIEIKRFVSRAFRPFKEYDIAVVKLDKSGSTLGVILDDCEVI